MFINFEHSYRGKKVQLKVNSNWGRQLAIIVIVDDVNMSWFSAHGTQYAGDEIVDTFKFLNELLNDPSIRPWHYEISYLYTWLEEFDRLNTLLGNNK